MNNTCSDLVAMLPRNRMRYDPVAWLLMSLELCRYFPKEEGMMQHSYVEIQENSIKFFMETEFGEFSPELEDHFEIFEHIRRFNETIVTSANKKDETLILWSGFLLNDEDPNPWQISGSLGGLATTVGGGMYMHSFQGGATLLSLGLIFVLYTMFVWWRDVYVNLQKLGICPPKGIGVLDPWEIPLLNTPILPSSGAAVTWAHHAIPARKGKQAVYALVATVSLALVSTGFEGMEYYQAPSTISDNIYGSTFFLATGFHGFHVIIGTLFLIVCGIRQYLGHLTKKHHVGFEAAAWYWHFVDVVRLFPFVSIYWWGGI
ncbi:hypothetical protein VPH35_058572 [Triticum aestivum]